jgi:hypothetical protein
VCAYPQPEWAPVASPGDPYVCHDHQCAAAATGLAGRASPDCYDYPGHIAFNWHAPELWRRFTINLRRALARQTGLTAAEFTRRCRVSFVKVAEFQRCGVVHFHALIRLDSPGEDYQPPQISIEATELAEAIRQASAHVRLTVEMPDGPDWSCASGRNSTPKLSTADRQAS